jgi:antitoxin component YwqK of YwqJK toxin-antitoxin module/Tfp pilus assembly protein PilF
MMRICMWWIACLLTVQATAQKIPLIRSGEILDKGGELYDSAKYEEAILEYKKIPKRDTNYVTMLYRMGIAYAAHKKYDSALYLYQQVLSNPIDFRARVLRAQANGLVESGAFDQGIASFEEASRQYPIDQGLLMSKAGQYYDEKQYEKAKQIYFQILAMNPFSINAHLNLALLSMGQGRKAHAMLSMGMYLAIQNSDNPRLVLIDKFLDNQLQDEGSMAPFGTNASDKLDQIIRAKIALDKNFKSEIPIGAAVVKQYELLFDQLALLNGNTNDEWVNFYLPIYKTIKEQQHVQPFIYHILTSADNEVAKKWRKKNEKLLSALYTNLNKEISTKAQKLAAPKYNIQTPVPIWRDDNGLIDALGEKKDDVRVGRWVYFFNNSELQSEGSYDDKGQKIGTWNYYYDIGKIKSVENYETGEVTVYNRQGNKSEYFFLKDDEIQGEAILYYTCGMVSEKINYDKGKRHGQTQSFYISGKPLQKYSYKEGKVHGLAESYFENGKLSNQMSYVDGKLNGTYNEYFTNGRKSSEGTYTNDNPTGTWKYYYSNGKLNRTGTYSPEGNPVGEWLYYDQLGQLAERRLFDNEGRLTDENTTYTDGIKHYVLTYKKGSVIKSTSFKNDGKPINSFGAADGTFAVKYYYPTGELMTEGAYKNGSYSGEWKYYTRFGKVKQIAFYDQNKMQGLVKDYYPTGELKAEKEYNDDQLHGYVVTYHRNGKKMEEGWYQNGVQEQQWKGYHLDGSVQSDYYYLSGSLTDDALDYGLDGKVNVTTTFDQYGVKEVKRHLSNGATKSNKKTVGPSTVIEDLYPSNKPKVKYTISCGKYIDDLIKYYPDGSPFIKNSFVSNLRNGSYEHWEINGQKVIDGYYENGEAEGRWRYYQYNGKPSRDGYYRDGEMDSIWTYYHENGVIESVGTFLNDERQGITRYYSPEGIPLLEKKLDASVLVAYRSIVENENAPWKPFTGNERIEIKNKNGVVQWVEEWKGGVRQGKLKLFYENGTLFSEYTYDKGDLHGPVTIHYPNGKIWIKQNYNWNEVDGKEEVYAEDGSLIMQSEYRLGIRDGKSTLFEKGNKKKEFVFWNGMIEE